MFLYFAIFSCIFVIISNAVNLQQNRTETSENNSGLFGNITLKPNKPTVEGIGSTNSTLEDKERKQQLRDYSLKHLLPNKTYCGKQHWDDYSHVNDTQVTEVNEFPWTIALELFKICKGVLINARYVLTTRFCGKRENKVKIGEHNWFKNVSCTVTPYGNDCTDPKRLIAIEEHIELPGGQLYLLRLAEIISYSDYVRPICLPMHEHEVPKVNDTVVSTVWGSCLHVLEKCILQIDTALLKKKLPLRVIQKTSPLIKSKVQICTVPLEDDYLEKKYFLQSGAPIMYKYKKNWILSGMIQQENRTDYCGKLITPEIVTAILENMRK